MTVIAQDDHLTARAGPPVHEPNCKEKEVHRPIRSTNSGLGSAVFVLSSLARFVWIYMKYIHLCY